MLLPQLAATGTHSEDPAVKEEECKGELTYERYMNHDVNEMEIYGLRGTPPPPRARNQATDGALPFTLCYMLHGISNQYGRNVDAYMHQQADSSTDSLLYIPAVHGCCHYRGQHNAAHSYSYIGSPAISLNFSGDIGLDRI
jgi:hypothetical protein